MTLRVPVTASSVPEWVRLAGMAINALIGRSAGSDASIAALQAADTALGGRVDALETTAPTPVVTSVLFTPSSLPASPVTGQTVYDQADNIIKTWDGGAWKAHY